MPRGGQAAASAAKRKRIGWLDWSIAIHQNRERIEKVDKDERETEKPRNRRGIIWYSDRWYLFTRMKSRIRTPRMEEIERKETGEHQNNLNVIYRRSRRALINRFFLFLVVFLFIFLFPIEHFFFFFFFFFFYLSFYFSLSIRSGC